MTLLYAVIDITKTEESKILYLADFERATLWGRILADRGRKVVAPVLDAKAFSKLEHLSLQYLFWNNFAVTPAEDYGKLVQDCLQQALSIVPDATELRWLERECERIEKNQMRTEYDEAGLPVAKAPKAPGEVARPRTAGATQAVWTIADEMSAKAGGQIPDRKAVIDECVRQGVNSATASTQFSKWKSNHVCPS